MATAGGEKMAGEYASRRESGDTGNKVFKGNRNRGKRRSKGKRVGVGAEERSSQVKTCMSKLRGRNPKVVVIAVTTARLSRNGLKNRKYLRTTPTTPVSI